MGDSERNTDKGGCKDADENASLDLEHYQDGSEQKAYRKEDAVGGGEISEGNQGGVIVYDDSCVLQADESDVKAYTCSNGFLKCVRDCLYNEVADLGYGKDDEDDTLKQDGCQGELPAISHSKAYGVNEECVQTHTRSKSERLLGIESHYQRTNDGRQCGCREHGVGRHTLVSQSTEDAGVDGQDIGHSQERGDSRYDLCPDIVLLGIKSEKL